jgi:hypothetical protein
LYISGRHGGRPAYAPGKPGRYPLRTATLQIGTDGRGTDVSVGRVGLEPTTDGL